MDFLLLSYLAILALSGIISIYLSMYIRKKEKTIRQNLFSLLMILCAFWCFSYLIELISGPSSMVFFADMKFIAIMLIPAAFCSFILAYTETIETKNIKLFLPLFTIPLINITFLFTNNLHHLFWTSQEIIQTKYGLAILNTNGPVFWFHTMYSYMLILIGVWLTIKSLFNTRDIYTKQAILLILGITAPITGNLITVFNLIPLRFDLTPLLFVITGISFSLAIIQYHLFSIVPIARKNIIETIPEAIFVLDNNDHIIDYNHAAKQMIKNNYITYGNQHITGVSAYKLFRNDFDPSLLNHSNDKKEIDLSGTNGKKIFELQQLLVFNKKNIVKGKTIIFRDITQRKQNELKERERIKQIQNQQKAVASLSKNQLLLTGEKQKTFALITETAAKLLQIERASIWLLNSDQTELQCVDLYIYSKNKHESGAILKEKDYPTYFKSLFSGRAIDAHDARNDPRTFEFTESYLKPLHIVSMLDAPIWMSGRLIGVLCHEQLDTKREWKEYETSFSGEIADQISQLILNAERKKAVDELKNAHLELKEMNKTLEEKVEDRTKRIEQILKQKDEFINQLGHDLKNPIGPLINLLPILERHSANPKDKEMFEVVMRNVKYMKNLVKKTLELAHLNSPNTRLHYEPVQLNALIQTVIENNQYSLKDININIKTEMPDDINIIADELRIEELFTNLLSNAIKYSPNGGLITINVEKNINHMLVSLSDEGQGMTQDQINQIFDEFYKADDSRHDFKSSGLGMPICRRIIEKHGGKIWAESQGLDKGTTIYFTLPFEPNKIQIKENQNNSYEHISRNIDQILS